MVRILFILTFIGLSQFGKAQIIPAQIIGKTPLDSLHIMVTEKSAASLDYGLGKWYHGLTLIDSLVNLVGMDNWLLAATGTGGTASIVDNATVTFSAGGINTVARSGNTITYTGTEVDGSVSNELQTLANTSAATTHTLTLSNSGGSTQFVEGSGITLTTTGTGLDGIVTIAATSGSQTLATTSDATSHTTTLSGSGGSQKLIEGTGITLTTTGTGLDGIATIATTALLSEVDGSTTNELNTIEEGNVSVQTGNTNIDFQTLFDVATDGAVEVNVSLDLSEATTVTTAEADDWMIMHDAGLAQHQKMLWSDFVIDIITFKEDNVIEGNGNTFDFGIGIDLSAVGVEADISLDLNEFPTDAVADADEYVVIWDADATSPAGEKRLASSFGGADGNGIYTGDGTTPADVDVTVTDSIDFDNGTLFIDGAGNMVGIGSQSPDYTLDVESTTAQLRIYDTNGGTGNTIELHGNVNGGGTGTGVMAGISYKYLDGGAAVEAFDIEAYRRTNDVTHSTLIISATEATQTDAITVEKMGALSDNTHETTTAFNSGVRYSQVYESTTGALTLDRGYYNLVLLSGHVGSITLPEISTETENYSSISSTTVGVGQEYVITNLSGGTINLLVTSTDLINNSLTTFPMANNDSYIIKASALIGTVGRWMTYD